MFGIAKTIHAAMPKILIAVIIVASVLRISTGVSYVDATLIGIVTVLTCIQSTIDIRSHQLHRPTTLLGTLVVTTTVVADAVASRDGPGLSAAVLATLIVSGSFALLHRMSPRSLGFGDVLLVIPLSLALGYIALDRIVTWQFAASCSAGTHAIVLRLRGGRGDIPFGPHLLTTAWLMLLVST